jgi:hypothetical protein
VELYIVTSIGDYRHLLLVNNGRQPGQQLCRPDPTSQCSHS